MSPYENSIRCSVK